MQFDLDVWSRDRNTKGTLADIVRQIRYSGFSYEDAIRAMQANYLAEVLLANEANQTKSAQSLGIKRETLAVWIRKCGIDGKRLWLSIRAAKGKK